MCFNKAILAIAVTSFLSGCASVGPINADGSKIGVEIKQDYISIVVVEEKPLEVITPGMATPGVTGLIPRLIDEITRPDGSDIKLPSPSYLLAKSLTERMSNLIEVKFDDVPNKLTKRDVVEKGNLPRKVTLEVYVDRSFVGYRPMAWQTYQYMMNAHARIINRQGVVVWQNNCEIGGLTADESLQLDRLDFKNNDAKRFIDIMQLAANRCTDKLTKKL